MTPHVNPTLERLRLARIQRGISAKDLASDAGLSPQTLQNWDRDQCKKPHLLLIGAVARALNVPLEWLLYGEGPNPFNNEAPAGTEASTSAR